MIKITVPATSANIGGGFDCLGLAVNIYNEIYVRESDKLVIDTDEDLPSGKDNLVYKSMELLFDKASEMLTADKPEILKRYESEKTIPVYIKQINNIPKTSGLGSSAACIVGGVMAANQLLGDVFTKSQLADICTKEEGHPDNVLPALFGGVVAGCITEDGVKYIKKDVSKAVKLNVYTPSFPLSTSESRKVLPSSYGIKDVVYSLSRAVVTFAALENGDIKLLESVVGDKLHEPYRSGLIPDYDNVVAISTSCGAICSYLSGAGPSIASFVTSKFKADEMKERLSFLPNNWQIFECDIINKGVIVETINSKA